MSPKLKLKKVKGKKVKPRFQRGAGLWMLVFCPAGHLIAQLRRGDWVDGKKRIKSRPCYCTMCAREEEAALVPQAA